MTRRAMIGDLGGGVFGLVCSRPGYDVTTVDRNDPIQTSFYSEWTDIAKVLDIGYATPTVSNDTYAVSDPGFIPWLEVRQGDGTTVYDDRTTGTWSLTNLDGLFTISKRGSIQFVTLGATFQYLVFNVPVPSQ